MTVALFVVQSQVNDLLLQLPYALLVLALALLQHLSEVANGDRRTIYPTYRTDKK